MGLSSFIHFFILKNKILQHGVSIYFLWMLSLVGYVILSFIDKNSFSPRLANNPSQIST